MMNAAIAARLRQLEARIGFAQSAADRALDLAQERDELLAEIARHEPLVEPARSASEIAAIEAALTRAVSELRL